VEPKAERGASEDEPPLCTTRDVQYVGDMYWLCAFSTTYADRLTRKLPEWQKMLEPSSAFYDPHLDRASTQYSSTAMVNWGKHVYFLVAADLSLVIRKPCMYVFDLRNDRSAHNKILECKEKNIWRLKELESWTPTIVLAQWDDTDEQEAPEKRPAGSSPNTKALQDIGQKANNAVGAGFDVTKRGAEEVAELSKKKAAEMVTGLGSSLGQLTQKVSKSLKE